VVTELAAFIGISVVVIVTPGQDTALTIRNTLLGGRRGGVFTALGVVAGQAAWAVATSAGVAALLVASEPAFAAVRLVGAAYLVYLGALGLRAALGSSGRSRVGIDDGSPPGIAPRIALRQGLISNLGNPKMAVFFTSLLPQFAAGGEGSFFVLLLLGIVFCLLTLAWLTSYAVAIAKAGDFLRRPRVRRALDGLTGAVLLALGVRVASEHR
jgi:threonine/homoserine/homoserine lactone efflux protein